MLNLFGPRNRLRLWLRMKRFIVAQNLVCGRLLAEGWFPGVVLAARVAGVEEWQRRI